MRVIQVRRPPVGRQTGNGGHAAAKLRPSPAMDAVFDLQRSVGNRVTTELIGRTLAQRDLSSDLRADLDDFPDARERDTYGTRVEGLRTRIEHAQASERDAASKNKKVLEAAESALGAKDYAHFLAWIRVYTKGGKVEHTRVETADEKIKEKIGELIKGSVAGGAVGRVAVVNEKQWSAVIRGYTSNPVERSQISQTNAFTAPDGYIYIHSEKGDAGTLIHESVHFYAPDACLRALGEPLNEGLTEYFARLVMPAEVGSKRTKYPKGFAFAVDLLGVVGQDALAKAYFQGDVAGVQSAFAAEQWQPLIKTIRGPDDKKFSDEWEVDWGAAKAHLRGTAVLSKAEELVAT